MEERELFRWDELSWYSVLRDLVINLWVVVLAGFTVWMGVDSVVQLRYVPAYTSYATMAVTAKGSDISIYSNLTATTQMAEVIGEVFASNVLREKVVEELAVTEFDGEIKAEVIPETNMLTVQVTAPTAKQAHQGLWSAINHYSLNGYSEKLTDQGRMLFLENYTGPTIQVDSEVQLTVTQLGNLPGVLAERKQLEADNGYGKEITGQVSWYREKTAEGEYSIFFTVSNEFGDVATAQCRAYIDGVKDDIVLTLRQEQISISQNEPFVPLDWVLEAEDANGENLIDGVEVEGTVNSSVPGNYTITYRLTSLDGRQCATRNLSVKVNETA